jgi:hypothetical protein
LLILAPRPKLRTKSALAHMHTHTTTHVHLCNHIVTHASDLLAPSAIWQAPAEFAGFRDYADEALYAAALTAFAKQVESRANCK